MSAYEYALANNIVGTDEEIVAQVKATGITQRAIELSHLLELLNFRNLLRKTDGSQGDERWKGTLQNLKGVLVALGLTEAVTGYETWFSHVTNPRSITWDTSKPEYAAQFWQLYQNFAGQPDMPTEDDFQAIASLGGGFRFANLTVEAFVSQKASATLQAQKKSLEDAAINTLQQFREALSAWDGTGDPPVLGA